MSLTTKVTVAKFTFLNEKSYNKTVIDFNLGRHTDLSTLKSDIHLGLEASVNYHFFGEINPFVYLIKVNNSIIFPAKRINIHLKMQNTTLKYFNNSC